ncbi:MAG TPA: hypothetical protein VGI45_27780 [Terracidiphilus sp.]|jgi:hypothetical protein
MKRRLENEAAEALRETLSQISVVKVKTIGVEPAGRADKSLIARVEISGHAHILVCKVAGDSEHLQRTFDELKGLIAHFPGATTPVLIAPALSDEARALCNDGNTGFLDLEGNARLYFDEVFIAKRSLPHHKKLPSRAESLPTSETAHFAQVA